MSGEDKIDIEKELDNLLTKVQPNLQDVIKRSFTNVALQQTKNGEQTKPDTLEDTSYFAKNTQVISLSNMTADVNVGLILEDDAFSFINPGIEFVHDEVLVKLSWPSPQRGGGYDFSTTEQLAKHIDDLPLTAAISLPLYALLREKLQRHLELVLRQATSVSEVVCCNPSLFEAYTAMVDSLAARGNKVVDMLLINMRRTLAADVPRAFRPASTPSHLYAQGKFETEPGWVKNLATINRVSDVSVTQPHPMQTCFHFTLRIKDFQIGYDEYRIKAIGISSSGRVAATYSRASLHAAITVGLVHWEPYAQLDDLRVQHMDSMDIHITGLGPLSSVSSLVGAWVRGAGGAHAAPAVARQLQHEMHVALAELPVWDIMRHGKSWPAQ
ncbi:unnamed protein product [Diatraea saccharalis]|uniref:Uncharacterized protein n=1 Tax=Diatraea saccharalis TaxID=40085 RepID=A0A9N9R0F8_9NEOP|nr:unnamed protein product [Diatraea saccharalis]